MNRFLSCLLLVTSGFSSQAFSDQFEDQDSNPAQCAQIRQEAAQVCRGDADCYTAEVSRLVDAFNYHQERDGQEPSYLFCTY